MKKSTEQRAVVVYEAVDGDPVVFGPFSTLNAAMEWMKQDAKTDVNASGGRIKEEDIIRSFNGIHIENFATWTATMMVNP